MDSRGPGLEKGINSHRGAGGGGREAMPLPPPPHSVFDRSVDPILTRGAYYAHLTTTSPLPLKFLKGTASLIELVGMSPHTQTGPAELGSQG